MSEDNERKLMLPDLSMQPSITDYLLKQFLLVTEYNKTCDSTIARLSAIREVNATTPSLCLKCPGSIPTQHKHFSNSQKFVLSLVQVTWIFVKSVAFQG